MDYIDEPRTRSAKKPVANQPVAKQLAKKRRGAAAVLGLMLIVSLVVLMAVTMDYGYITVAQAELRRSADSSAMAACWELYDQDIDANSTSVSESSIVAAANEVAYLNGIGGDAPSLSDDDVEIGFFDITNPAVFDTGNVPFANAVRVTLRRQSTMNGEVPLFFGGLTGRETQSLHAKATAAMLRTVAGFHTPTSSSTVNIFPFALDLETWNDVMAGNGPDNYRFDGTEVQSGGDGIPECNLYPKDTGAPGNRGTVDIGGANNSTSDLSRQILHGVSTQDFIDLGHPLEFNSNGELQLNGDTGISAGVKDEIASVIGKKRIIPIFSSVSGNGNNAMYTIVRFEGVRILDVKLTGPKKKKHLTIQPAKVLARGAIIDTSGTMTTNYLYTPVLLVD